MMSFLTKKNMMNHRVVFYPVIFLCFFLFFFLRNHHYLRATLQISGDFGKQEAVAVQWDSGMGFNAFESQMVELGNLVWIKNLGGASSKQENSEIWIKKIFLDGKETDWLSLEKLRRIGGDFGLRNGSPFLSVKGNYCRFATRASKLTFIFATSPSGGIVKVEIAGIGKELNLHSSAEGEAVLEMDNPSAVLPRTVTFEFPPMKIHAIKIEAKAPLAVTSIKLMSAKGEETLALPPAPAANYFFNRFHVKTEIFHPVLFSIHILLSLWMTYLVYELLRWKASFGNWKKFFYGLFYQNKRWLFWIMFAGGCAAFSFWWAGQWPAVVNGDAIASWLMGQSMIFSDYQPYFYSLYLLVLRQFADTPACIVFFQMITTSALGSFIFYFVMKQGVRWYWVVPCYVCFIISIPVGLYTVDMVKDIPFALGTLLLAFLIYFFLDTKRQLRTLKSLSLISVLIALVAMLRHNGIIYFLIIPGVLILTRIVPPRKIIVMLILTAGLFLFFDTGLKRILGIDESDKYLERFWVAAGSFGSIYSSGPYYSDSEADDQRVLEGMYGAGGLDFLRKMYNPGNDVHATISVNQEYLRQHEFEIYRLFFKRASQNLHKVLADRVYMALAMLGFSERIPWVPRHEVYWPDHLGMQKFCDEPAFSYIWYFYQMRTKACPALKLLQEKIYQFSVDYNGMFGRSFFFWNRFYIFLILSIIIFLYAYFPRTAIFSFIILSQSIFIMLLCGFPTFRYLYFLYLTNFFWLPLLALEWKKGAPKRGR